MAPVRQLGRRVPWEVWAVLTLIVQRSSPLPILRGVSWSVLPLVAGLFVLVEALDHAGLISWLGSLLVGAARASTDQSAWTAGLGVGFASNLMNNLPAGLVAARALQSVDVPDLVHRAVLIGVDLGPNLSVTGSLATILWLNALRREGYHVGAATFLKLGVLVMPPALAAALFAAWLV